jgi:hypothetical protein
MPVASHHRPWRRSACAVAACCVVIVAANAGSASAQSARASQEEQATVRLMAATAGLGTLTISPGADGTDAVCQIDGQQDATGGCTQDYAVGTVVTLTAAATSGSFIGWSDFGCSKGSTRCVVTMTEDRFITARFNQVTLSIQGTAFGRIALSSPSGAFCELIDDAPPCAYDYRAGTLVSLRRTDPAKGAGLSWVGACEGNVEGLLNATVCRVRLNATELIGAGYDNVTAIPPPRGSALHVVISGRTRGKVTGTVINKNRRLNCGATCKLSGLWLYDAVRLKAVRKRGSRFVGWSDGSKLTQRVVQLSSVTRIKATFARARRR